MTRADDITLAIETSNPSGCGLVAGSAPGVAVARGREVIGVERMDPRGRHDDDLMPAIDRLVRRCGVTPRDITRVAVSVGPGGFTGLRVAVVTAAMIATVNGGMCVSVPTALVLARRWPVDRPAADRWGVSLCAKGERAHASVVEPDARGAPSARLHGMLDACGFEALGIAAWIADGHLPAHIRLGLEARGAVIMPAHYDPAACAEASFDLPGVEPAALRPIYAREPEAVTLWNARKRGEDR